MRRPPVRDNGWVRQHNIIWDMGGTLIDTYPSVDRTLVRALEDHGHRVDPQEVAGLTRRAIAVAIAELSARYAVPREDLDRAYADLKRSWATRPAPVMAGAREVMDHVRSISGRNMVVTNRDRRSATTLLTATNLAVDDLVCAPDGYPRKPDPAMYLAVLERNRLDPADCLAVGDRAIDAVASRQAGIECMLLETPGNPVEGKGNRITDLRELLGHLAGAKDQPIRPST